LLHAEAIASSMLCAGYFRAHGSAGSPALLAIALALFAFHYYLVPPINSFTWKSIYSPWVSRVPRLILFSVVSLVVAFMVSAQRKTTEALRRSGDDLLAANADQKAD